MCCEQTDVRRLYTGNLLPTPIIAGAAVSAGIIIAVVAVGLVIALCVHAGIVGAIIFRNTLTVIDRDKFERIVITDSIAVVARVLQGEKIYPGGDQNACFAFDAVAD